jgi:hypothetical protein
MPYSQRDPRWGNKYLGFSRLYIKDYGCALTALTMLLNTCGHKETPDTVNAKLKKIGGFDGAMIIWSKVPQEWNVKLINLPVAYNNLKVAYYVYIKRIPVIVKVDFSPKKGVQDHWVLYIGNRMMIDPWDGKGKPTKTYPALKDVIYDKR